MQNVGNLSCSHVLCGERMFITQTRRIVCIGGDGVFHEVFNSLLWRQQYEMFGAEARKVNPEPCPIKIGLIPAGILSRFSKNLVIK